MLRNFSALPAPPLLLPHHSLLCRQPNCHPVDAQKTCRSLAYFPFSPSPCKYNQRPCVFIS